MITRSRYARAIFVVFALTITVYPVSSQDGLDAAEPSPGEQAADGAAETNPARDGERSLLFSDTGEPGDGVEETPEIGTFGVGDLLRMVLVLVLVAGAVYGVIALLRRRIPTREDDGDSPIQVLAGRRVGANNEVFAVMVGKSVFLLGGSDTGLRRLATIDDQETIDELVLAHSRATPIKKTFARSLGEWFSNLAVPGSPGDEKDAAVRLDANAGIQHRLQRLRRM